MSRPIPLVDLAFLLLERAGTSANVGVVLVFEPPPGTRTAACVREVVRVYRRAAPEPPFERIAEFPPLGLPRWRTVGDLDAHRHVLRARLPAPGGLRELEAFVARRHGEPLEPTRPLFRVWVLDGLPNGRFALYVKSHHALWDGRSAMARLFGALGREPGPIGPPFFALRIDAGEPEPVPQDTPSIAGRLVGQARAVEQTLRAIAGLATRSRSPGSPTGNAPFGGPRTLLNGPIGRTRAFAALSLPLEAMHRLGVDFGGTVNDVLLAIVDDTLERYLTARGERPSRPLVSMCPVSLRDAGDVEARTKAASLFVRLAQPGTAPVARLRAIIANAAAAKRELRGLSRQAALDLSLLVFGCSLATRGLTRDGLVAPPVNLTVSNVGGLPGPFFLGESRLVGAYPVSMVAEPVGLNVTAVSCDGRLDIGVIADRGAVPDARAVADLLQEAFARLQRSARRARPSQDLPPRNAPRRQVSRTRRMPASQRG